MLYRQHYWVCGLKSKRLWKNTRTRKDRRSGCRILCIRILTCWAWRAAAFRVPDHTFRPVMRCSVQYQSQADFGPVKTLKQNMEDEGVWTESYAKAAAMRSDLQDKLKVFGDSACMDACKKKVDLIRRKRARNRRKKRESCEEIKEKEARASEKDAAIEKWRMKRIQQVEEKKRELELRQAADSVLSEVRKKQADAKRMTDVLRSLEKLRRLRKEAAAKKGVHPEKEADEVFEGHLERLRRLIRKRTAVYAAEEKALRVMLEGEREEERKREQERKHRKEREKQLQRRREVECVLFGDEMPSDHPLQPYRQYYLQAETSLHALIQTRRAWDQYLVPSDVPEGSFIPQSWVLPELPSDEVWSTALDKQNTGGD
ncbi:programmed cell death protein 7 [Paramormyrops kingsleyae]|uniref:programmed cell death protein 7 n=1 Tax=Paramormyrops kingsleyae TaxID=1676925 RepID=UPI000CD5F2C9|nr:programmed cell death protein 7 [Paramormyrops kingsleyae]